MKKARPGQDWGWAVLSAVLLHASVVVVVVGVAFWIPRAEPVAQRLAIEASVVTQLPVSASPAPRPTPIEPEPLPPEPEPVIEPELEAFDEPPLPALPDVADALRREAEAREQAERAQAEREKAAREKAEREKAAREKAERERREQARLAKEKAEREKVERERAAAERARAQREAELNAQIAAEERRDALRASGQMNQYIAQITARIERAWIRPPSARVGLTCEVRVTQVPGGAVTGVQVGRCNGDEAVRQSIEAAVYRASPLPPPSDDALFDRNLVITFRPEG